MGKDWDEVFERKDFGNFRERNFEFRKNKDGTVALVKCYKKEGEVEIPEGVYDIREKVFKKSCICSVKFPDSLRVIGAEAFFGCKNLSNIEFGRGSVKIGEYAFEYCSGLASVDFCCVSEIQDFAFAHCKKLSNVVLHEGLKEVGFCTFFDCPKMKEVSLPASVSDLGASCFYDVDEIEIQGDQITSDILDLSSSKERSAGLTISYNGNTLIFPKRIAPYMWDATKEKLREYGRKKGERESFFEYVEFPVDGRLIALDSYLAGPDQKTELYLEWEFPDLNEDGERFFLNMIRKRREFGALPKELYEKALAVSQDHGWALAAAYILDCIRKDEEGEEDGDEGDRLSL